MMLCSASVEARLTTALNLSRLGEAGQNRTHLDGFH